MFAGMHLPNSTASERDQPEVGTTPHPMAASDSARVKKGCPVRTSLYGYLIGASERYVHLLETPIEPYAALQHRRTTGKTDRMNPVFSQR
jgi:hypothetical protein